MKFYVLIVCKLLFLFTACIVHSQTEKGTMVIGLNSALNVAGNNNGLSINSTDIEMGDGTTESLKSFSLELTPRIGYFIFGRTLIGADIRYGFRNQDVLLGEMTQTEKVKTNSIGAGPFIRQYFQFNKLQPFLEAGVVFGRTTTDFENSTIEQKSNNHQYGGGLGLAIFIGNSVSFDCSLGYYSFRNEQSDEVFPEMQITTNGLTMTLGFTVYLRNEKQ